MILFLRDSLPSMHKRTLIDHITYQQKIHDNKSNNTRNKFRVPNDFFLPQGAQGTDLRARFVLYYDAALGYF